MMRAFIGGGVTGCEFARSLQKHRHGDAISWLTLHDIEGFEDTLETAIDEASKVDKACGVVLPSLSSEEDIILALRALCRRPRWRGKVLSWPDGSSDDRVPFGLYWTTIDGGSIETSALGVASTFSMPVTRRGPVVAVIVYAGAHRNGFRKAKKRGHGGFVAMSPGANMKPEAFEKLWTDTRANVNAVREPGMNPEIAFVFSSRMKDALAQHFPEST